MASNGNLTPAQELFAQHVAAGKSQAEAYRTAYPKSVKWKDSAVWCNASKLMADTKVSQRVEELKAKHATKFEITAERILLEIARIAYFDPRKLYHPDGSPIPINELDDDTAAALAGLDIHEEYEGTGKDRKFIGYTKKYKVSEKNAALDKLAKYRGLYELDNKQKTNPLAELLSQLGGNVLGVAKTGEGDK
jgi:phage terminase small subunit